jgi:hypothetical protein
LAKSEHLSVENLHLVCIGQIAAIKQWVWSMKKKTTFFQQNSAKIFKFFVTWNSFQFSTPSIVDMVHM